MCQSRRRGAGRHAHSEGQHGWAAGELRGLDKGQWSYLFLCQASFSSFHHTASAYVYPGMNKLSDSQYITIEKGVSNCWKADGLTLLHMPDKNKKKKNTGLQPYSHRLRSCQIPSAREIWIWWLVSNGIFQGQKNPTPTFYCFCTSLTTSAYHERKEKFAPCQSFLLMIPVYPQLCGLLILLQPSFFPFYCKYFNSIIFIDKQFIGNIRNQQSLLMRSWAKDKVSKYAKCSSRFLRVILIY